MDYKVVPLDGGSQFDLNGVRFRGNTFLFWKKKDRKPITEVVVIFDKKYENMQVRDGVVILSLKGIHNYNDIREALQIIQKIFSGYSLSFRFMVENDRERKSVEELASGLGISYFVQVVGQNRQQQEQKTVAKMEEEMKSHNSSDLMASGSQIIEKHENGVVKQITVHDGVAYENNGMLNTEEEKVSLLREWMQDPRKAEELQQLSEAARNELLTQAVMSNRKGYRMESASQAVSHNEAGEVAIGKASEEDGLVNTELNIVQNNVSSSVAYSAVEQDHDKIQVVDSQASDYQIRANGITATTSGKVVQYENYQNSVQLEEKAVQQRNVYVQLFVDKDGNVFDREDNWLGELKEGDLSCRDDRIYDSYGRELGIRSTVSYEERLEQLSVPNRENDKRLVRTKKKEDAAFVSLPVIIFIMSALLLIASIVLLFVIE